MSLFEWWDSLGLALQIFYCIAVPSTLILVIQTVLMFLGLEDSAEGDLDIDAPDADFDDGVLGDDITDISDVSGLESLHIFTVRGIIAFLVVFGWVGVVMQSADISLYFTVPVATVCAFAVMIAIAYLFKAVMKLKSNGAADNRNAVGSAGKVYLTIPPSRSGEGKVNVMLQGAYVERNAVTDETEAIPTGCEIIVIGLSGQTNLVVKRK
ncbi:MAG: hypothetical protein E7614_08400 [Ruminococcaceae bacterium]|nr:hypothetical protein [Oscillospiraceae bacterium]